MISKAGISVLPVIVFATVAQGGLFGQMDWSGGGGVPGPVTQWESSFQSSTDICWDGLPGYLVLGLDATRHTISSDMYGCNFTFPIDMDLDGDMDVVASQTSSPYHVSWFENDGNGLGWAEHVVSSGYSGVICAYPGDLDNDGDIDVIGANIHPDYSSIEWWENLDGFGKRWQRFSIDDDFGGPLFACCADIDGDGTPEVLSTSGTDPDETAWWDKDDFTPPQPPWVKHVVTDDSFNGFELFPVDLDQDGDLDILVAHYSSDGLVLYENMDGMGTSWEAHELIWPSEGARSVHAADADGDGDLDIVSCGADNDSNWLWLVENQGGDNWVVHVLDMVGNEDDWLPFGVHAADVTGDDQVDILCAVMIWNIHEVGLYRNITGSVDMFAKYVIAGGSSWYTDVDVADFDADGSPDVLVASQLNVEIAWYDIDCPLQGSLTSSILDAQGWPEWESIEWTSVEPEGTDITFQVRGSNDPNDMGAWSDTLSEPCSLTGHLDSTYRFIQYRVNLQMEEGAHTPYLEQVLIHFSSMGVEEGQGGEPLALSVAPNPFTALALISVTGPVEGTAVRVYDISGRLIRELSPNAAGAYEWHGLNGSGETVPAGCYLVRAVRGEQTVQAQVIHI